MANTNGNQLEQFASIFLSADLNDRDSSSSQARASFLLPTAFPANHVVCSVTSFSLEKRKNHSGRPSKESLALDVASRFDDELQFVASNMQSLGPTITRNVLQSFMALVDSRVRSTVQALYNHAQHDSSQRLMQILRALSTMTDSLVTPTKASSTTRVVEGGISISGKQMGAQVLMQTTIEVDIMGEQLSIVLEATGTILAVLDEVSPSGKIVQAKVAFDTSAFLKTLMANARDIVKYATKRLFERFLTSSNNMQDAQGMNSKMRSNDNRQRSSCDDEKEGDSPRLSPSLSDMEAFEPRPLQPGRGLQSKLRNSYSNGKSLSGVDLLEMAAESLS